MSGFQNEAYKEQITWTFEVNGLHLSTGGVYRNTHGTFVEVEDTRKNGQEDCHMSELFEKRDGLWFLEDSDRGTYVGALPFDDYHRTGTTAAILEYLNANPPPTA